MADAAAPEDGAAEGLAVERPETGSALPPEGSHRPLAAFLFIPFSAFGVIPFGCGCAERVDVEEVEELEDSEEEELERWTDFRCGTKFSVMFM